MEKIVTRFPPSPTGFLHIGGARTALFNYLFTAHRSGTMYLRFEDTDQQRSKKEFEDDIVAGLQWLGISYEMSTIAPRQSERLNAYRKEFTRLIEQGTAYEAEESKDAPGKKVVRFKNPNSVITFNDLVRGEVSFDTKELGDFVIGRSIDGPLYHLAVVVDDHEVGITHVIRGEDHISNTPRQILILEALGFTRPVYAHIPLILAPDHSKLSKRHGAVSVNEYRAQGFIPEALINYLALLGWHPKGERELYTLAELVEEFTLDDVQKSGAIFDIEKLRWFNREHLRRLSDEEYAARLQELLKSRGVAVPAYLSRAVPLLKERAETFGDAAELVVQGELSFFDDTVSYNRELLLKGASIAGTEVAQHLNAVASILKNIPENDYTSEKIKSELMPYANEKGRGAVLWPLRVALSGKEKSPDPFTIAALIGKTTALKRIADATAKAVE